MSFAIDAELAKRLASLRELGRARIRAVGLEADRAGHPLPPEHPFFAELLRLGLGRTRWLGGEDTGQEEEPPQRRAGEPPASGGERDHRVGGERDHKPGPALTGVLISEELAYWDRGVAVAFPGPGLGEPPLLAMGTPVQKERFLAPFRTPDRPRWASFAMTEPGAGSDVAGIRTRARRVDGGWVVNGSKMFITNGVRADFLVTAVKTNDEGGHHGLSFLIVERGEGVSSSALHKLGWAASDTATIAFQDVFVPAENLLGELHGGFKLIMANFQWERLAMALGAVGAMRLAWERTAQFARERRAFGRPLSGHQAIAHKLADMASSVYACRCVTYDALRRFVAGEEPLKEVTMAKLLTQRAAFELMDECLQIHGGAGYMREYWVERAARDARLGPIGGGSDEVMREILAKVLAL